MIEDGIKIIIFIKKRYFTRDIFKILISSLHIFSMSRQMRIYKTQITIFKLKSYRYSPFISLGFFYLLLLFNFLFNFFLIIYFFLCILFILLYFNFIFLFLLLFINIFIWYILFIIYLKLEIRFFNKLFLL